MIERGWVILGDAGLGWVMLGEDRRGLDTLGEVVKGRKLCFSLIDAGVSLNRFGEVG